ncbi:TetR/AcrR family transcriptional regulator [Methylomonas sp. SURF-2]|uniref:TetR/AcrR family transcriptional regulator n=1 Tax=Methylomonas subterranea TaxID=2952225 RepID=A0ABT1TF44_9GAMM|nr:TetR/AcrR family transcriptional regulator [Methylomonas sp. SURF-2]MCQ8104055.1 TetR/AcrR family transcriptional regulator [Methylomonas sp. SURF-2]
MSQNLQERILRAASALFYRQGIKSTGVDAVVKAAGTTKMSLYKYFPSKDDLVLAYLDNRREAMRLRLLRDMPNTDSPKEKLLAVFDVFAELHADPEFRGCPFINAAAEFAEEGGRVQQAAAAYSASFRQLLAGLAEQAGARQADELAGHLSMLIAGAMVREQMQKGSGGMRDARKAAEILLGNYLAAAESPILD